MRVLTIIVSYNFVPWADRCLGSLRASTMHTDVMVIDNDSQDYTVDYVRQHYPEACVVANDANLGFGQANNIGMSKALSEGYDAVFLLNQDAWVAPDAIALLAAESERHGEGGIFSPIHLDGTWKALDFGFAEYTGLRSTADIPQTGSVEVPFVNAAFWFIPTETLRRVGGFSPLFYHYGEDTDYVNRLHRCSLTVRYVPAARACHDRQQRHTTRAMQLRAERVWHLSEYANPCHSICRAFAMGVLAAAKKGLRDLALMRIALDTLMLTPSVLRHRRIYKNKECYLHR